MPTNRSNLPRCNISLTGEEAELVEKLKIVLQEKLGVKKLSQAFVIRHAINKLAEEI